MKNDMYMSSSPKLVIKWKEIVYIKPKTTDCAMCYQSYTNETPICECHVCHQHLHCDCLTDWCVMNILNDTDPTCPFCRSIWKHNESLFYPIIESDTL